MPDSCLTKLRSRHVGCEDACQCRKRIDLTGAIAESPLRSAAVCVRILNRIEHRLRISRSGHLNGSVIHAVADGRIVAPELFDQFDDLGALLLAEDLAESLVRRRSIRIGGHNTSIGLEDAFWQALGEIAVASKSSIPAPVAAIDADREHANLSSTIRLFVLAHYRRCHRT
jgi:predicted DNA-binding ribbon-helix-helix protein